MTILPLAAENMLRFAFDTAIIDYMQIECFAPGTNCATGDQKAYRHIPPKFNGWELFYVHAEAATAGTTGTMDIEIRKNATDMLSTTLTMDSAETGTDTAATPAVIKTDGTEDVATNDVISVDFDTVHTTPAQGCVVTLGFRYKTGV